MLVVAVAAALAAAAGALAENYRFQRTHHDDGLAGAAVLKRSDLPASSSVRGGRVAPDETPVTQADACNGVLPKLSDLVVTGDAASRFSDLSGFLTIYTQVSLFRTPAMAGADVDRAAPQVTATCQRQQVVKGGYRFVRFRRLPTVAGYRNVTYLIEFVNPKAPAVLRDNLLITSVVVHGRNEAVVITRLARVAADALSLAQTIHKRAYQAVTRRI